MVLFWQAKKFRQRGDGSGCENEGNRYRTLTLQYSPYLHGCSTFKTLFVLSISVKSRDISPWTWRSPMWPYQENVVKEIFWAMIKLHGLKDWHPTARSLCSPNLGYACLRALKPRPARYLLAFDFFQMWNKKRTTSCTSASTVNRSFFVSYSSFGKVATFYPAFNSLLPPPPGLKLVFLFLFVSFFFL